MSKAEEDGGEVRNVPDKGKNKSKGLKLARRGRQEELKSLVAFEWYFNLGRNWGDR